MPALRFSDIAATTVFDRNREMAFERALEP